MLNWKLEALDELVHIWSKLVGYSSSLVNFIECALILAIPHGEFTLKNWSEELIAYLEPQDLNFPHS
jgi:hypothetical protein